MGGMPPMAPAMAVGPAGMVGGMAGVGQSVILVSNLVEGRVTCDTLFTLFGVVGDVLRVKIAFKNKSTALIQYREPSQAQMAVTHLNGKCVEVF